MIDLLIWICISAVGTTHAVEICHHSQIGGVWRLFWGFVQKLPLVGVIGDGGKCPFCFATWFGIAFVAPGAFYLLPIIPAGLATVIGGLAAARLANLLNDYFHPVCRTPNTNDEAGSARLAVELSDESALEEGLIPVAEEIRFEEAT